MEVEDVGAVRADPDVGVAPAAAGDTDAAEIIAVVLSEERGPIAAVNVGGEWAVGG